VGILVSLVVNAVAVFVTAYLISAIAPGSVSIQDPLAALVTAIVLAVVNALIKPVLLIITFPITVLTLGLFILVINALMVMLASAIVPGFEVSGFLAALVFSIVLGIINSVLHSLTR
jgi:putative membrane protein